MGKSRKKNLKLRNYRTFDSIILATHIGIEDGENGKPGKCDQHTAPL